MNVTGVILAAGLGTRLRPSTDLCPKPLIPVGGVEPLFFALSNFQKMGVKRVVVNAHYLTEQISDALTRWQSLVPGVECRISIEQPEILGTGGGLMKIIRENPDWFSDSGLLLQNGDTLANVPLKKLARDARENTFGISLRTAHLKKYKPLWIDDGGNWAGIGPTPPPGPSKPAHFLGIHYLSPEAVRRVREMSGEPVNVDLFNGVYRPLVDAGLRFKSCAYLEDAASEDFWFDMNTPEYLLEAQKYVLETLRTSAVWRDVLKTRYPAIREIAEGVWAVVPVPGSLRTFRAPAVMVESDAPDGHRLAGPLVLGPHASLIHEKGKFLQSPAQPTIEIKNSVVMVGVGSETALPSRIQNEIRVI